MNWLAHCLPHSWLQWCLLTPFVWIGCVVFAFSGGLELSGIVNVIFAAMIGAVYVTFWIGWIIWG